MELSCKAPMVHEEAMEVKGAFLQETTANREKQQRQMYSDHANFQIHELSLDLVKQ
jgi:hypothetical protein